MTAKSNNSFITSLGSMQLLAVLAVVAGHFWVEPSASVFLNSVGVSFCFVYSGFFTALRHPFGPDYGWREHGKFLWNKLSKLYPLHVLGIVLGVIAAHVAWQGGVGPGVLLAHLTLTSSWIPSSAYYFGANPVAWFVCDLFFLYLAAPLVVRALRRLPVVWQAAVMVLLLALEFIGGYSTGGDHSGPLFNAYHLYQFPPIRLLDFAMGIVLFNLTQRPWWHKLQQRLSPTLSTDIELGAVATFLLLYCWCEAVLHAHCYRAFCSSAPAILVLFASFIMTSRTPGMVSKLLCLKPITSLSKISAEVYLLQFGVYFLVEHVCQLTGIDRLWPAHIAVQTAALIIVSWLAWKFYVTPLYRRLRR